MIICRCVAGKLLPVTAQAPDFSPSPEADANVTYITKFTDPSLVSSRPVPFRQMPLRLVPRRFFPTHAIPLRSMMSRFMPSRSMPCQSVDGSRAPLRHAPVPEKKRCDRTSASPAALKFAASIAVAERHLSQRSSPLFSPRRPNRSTRRKTTSRAAVRGLLIRQHGRAQIVF